MLGAKLTQHIKQLAGEGSDPLAVAFSGGGDSTALLALVIDTLTDQNREIHALIVDHDLRLGSADEAKQAAARAHAMGAKAEILKWEHNNPETGLQEKARNARYALLGETCRRLGVSKLFLGHNQDDQAETVWMRQIKHSGWRGLSGMAVRVVAPIWPQLRDIEVIGPLLGQSREQLRAYNQSCGLAYIDDPSNENLRFERIKARHDLMEVAQRTEDMIDLMRESRFRLIQENQDLKKLFEKHVDVLEWGGVVLKHFSQLAGHQNLAGLLRFVLPSVSGQSGFPPSGKLKHLVTRLQSTGFKGATFAGTRLIGLEEGTILITRDPGMVMGRNQKPPLAKVKLEPDHPIVWDGRYLIETSYTGCSVIAAGLIFDSLSRQTKTDLKQMPLAARKAIPCLVDGNGNVTVPFLKASADQQDNLKIKSLILNRLNGFFRFVD